MPKALNVDWEPIRKDCLSGMTFQQLSDKYGVHPDTIAKRSSRFAWKPAPSIARKAAQHAVKHLVKQHVQAAIAESGSAASEAVREWVETSRATAKKLVSRVSEQLEQEQTPENLQRLAGALDRADGVGRKSLGMDKVESTTINRTLIMHAASVGIIDERGNLACLPIDYVPDPGDCTVDAEVVSEPVTFLAGTSTQPEPGKHAFSSEEGGDPVG